MPTRPSTDSVPAPRPRIAVLPLPAEPTLGTEVPAGLVRAATTAVATATGGGQVAVVQRDGGSIALWDGDAPRAGPFRVLVGGKPLQPTGPLERLPGGWRREMVTEQGIRVEETGLLPDLVPALVLQWAWIGREDAGAPESDGSASIDASAHAPMALREGLPPDVLLWEGRLGPHAPVTLALLPSELPESRARTLLTPLRARAKQRWIRGPAGGGPTLRMSLEPRVPGSAVADPLTGGPDSPGPEATSVEDLNAGIEILRESPLLPPGEGDARRPGGFLAGLTEGRPTLLGPAELGEVGLGALQCGAYPLALALLEELASCDRPPPLPFLHLAAEWLLWTGDPEPLRSFAEALESALAEASVPTPSPPSLPGRRALLERLVDALEPAAGAGWAGSLRENARNALQGPSGRGRALPVLGAATEAEGAPPTLPDPASFGSPEAAAFAPHRTLHAARLVRAWVEGFLGARPDAAYGRLRLAPKVSSGGGALAVHGLRVGDASLSLVSRPVAGGRTLDFRQDRGRVPLQLVFEPLLDGPAPREIRMGEEPAEVTIEPEGDGTRLRLQFPLDPERRLTLVR